MGERKKLLVIAFDGFRHDYVEQRNLVNFQRFLNEGARARYVVPVFPSLTYPNFYSISTGKYPEKHGVTGNNFSDPETSARFFMSGYSSHDDVRWYTMNDSEPFWITAKKAGLKVGSYMWPLSHVPFADEKGGFIQLDCVERLVDEDPDALSASARIDVCIDWIQKHDLDLALCYVDHPDHETHEHGPESDLMTEMLQSIDAAVAHLLQAVDKFALADKLDVIILSDHGATSCAPENNLLLKDIIGDMINDIDVLDAGAVLTFKCKDGAKLDERLLDRLRENGHLQVFRKDEVPDRFHWKNNRRSADVLVLCDEQYRLYVNEIIGQMRGDHGYDNQLTSMRAVLFARGPSFKRGYVTTEHTEMIDTYRLICSLLQLKPRPNDSSANTVLSLLK